MCTCDKHLKYSRGADDVEDEGLLDLIGSKVKINLTPTFAEGNHLWCTCAVAEGGREVSINQTNSYDVHPRR